MSPLENPPAATRRERLWSFVADASAKLWSLVRPWLWQGIVAALVIAFVVMLVRPFSGMSDPHAEDIAAAWNQSIARLGILPVFPPEEDFHVGDVWAVVAEADESTTPILGKAVRIGHISLRDDIKIAADRQQPVFVETTELKQGEKFRKQDRKEVVTPAADREQIALTIAAFPGITITHSARSAGSVAATFGGLGAARDDQRVEEIRIRTAETYGAPAPAAFFRLDDWCSNAKTKIYCTDEFVRRVIAFAVNDKVLAAKDGQYLTRLQLRLVTRVFLTREIEHRNRRSGTSGAAAGVSATPPAADTPPPGTGANSADNKSLEAQNDARLLALAQAINAAAAARSNAGSASAFRSDGTELELREIFQRPVVFGYRAITVSLVPATPAKEAPP